MAERLMRALRLPLPRDVERGRKCAGSCTAPYVGRWGRRHGKRKLEYLVLRRRTYYHSQPTVTLQHAARQLHLNWLSGESSLRARIEAWRSNPGG